MFCWMIHFTRYTLISCYLFIKYYLKLKEVVNVFEGCSVVSCALVSVCAHVFSNNIWYILLFGFYEFVCDSLIMKVQSLFTFSARFFHVLTVFQVVALMLLIMLHIQNKFNRLITSLSSNNETEFSLMSLLSLLNPGKPCEWTSNMHG